MGIKSQTSSLVAQNFKHTKRSKVLFGFVQLIQSIFVFSTSSPISGFINALDQRNQTPHLKNGHQDAVLMWLEGFKGGDLSMVGWI